MLKLVSVICSLTDPNKHVNQALVNNQIINHKSVPKLLGWKSSKSQVAFRIAILGAHLVGMIWWLSVSDQGVKLKTGAEKQVATGASKLQFQ